MDRKLFINGKIFTSQLERPFVNAFAVEEGRFIWAGNLDECPLLKNKDICDRKNKDAELQFKNNCKDFLLIDLQGRCVIPGIVDAHMHPVMLAEYARQIACLPPRINSIRELIENIHDAAQALDEDKAKGKTGNSAENEIEENWIQGWGYDEGKFEEKRSPNRYDLDKACKDRPVSIVRSCEHIRCVNSKALEIAGIDEKTPDPEGGEIERDSNGVPTGVLKESARNLIVPYMPVKDEDAMIKEILELGNLFSSQGIVAVADMGNFREGDNAKLFEKAQAKGFMQRVSIYYMWDFFKDKADFDVDKKFLSADSKVHIGGLKLIGDGSISGRTAWVHEPYLDGDDNDIGMPVYSDEDMDKAIRTAKRIGCGISVHAMGGRAIDRVLNDFAKVSQIEMLKDSENARSEECIPLRIEHATEPTPDAMKRAMEMNVGIITQPIFMYCEIESYKRNFDEARIKKAYPVKRMLEEGVKLALSTDAPATSWAIPSDPFVNIQAAVMRKAYDGTDLGQNESLDIETAIRLYTAEAAELMGIKGIGRIEEGYEADFIILDKDIFSIDKDKISEIEVLETYIDGQIVFEAQI